MQRRKFLNSILAASFVTMIAVVSTSAFARRGRPVSPNSVAGVRRRTRRRTRRRVHRNMQLSSLPYGCSTTRIRGGATYYYCGGIWYQPGYQGTTVVYIVSDIDAGADTNVEFEEDY